MHSSARSSVTVYGSSSLRDTYFAPYLTYGPKRPIARQCGLTLGGLAERARQLEELERVGERDRVHLLTRAQTGKARLLDIVLGADLHERAKAAHAHGDRFAARRIGAELARLRDLLA